MARLVVEGQDLVVRLSWWEKPTARRRGVRVPLSAVRRIRIEPDWWRALRGVGGRGTWIPGTLALGVRHLPGGTDFAAVRPGRAVACVELGPGAGFDRLAVTVAPGASLPLLSDGSRPPAG